jgi:hypothetical protein
MLEAGFKKLIKFVEIRRGEIGTVPIKIGIVHPKFDENIGIHQVSFFSTRQIFKHWLKTQFHGQLSC